MKIFRKDKKVKKQVRKLALIKQLKHKELLNFVDLPKKDDNVLFKNFDINEMIIKGLNAMNMIYATDIQAAILPHALKYVDVIASEKTGSGKTLAYLIPLLNLVLKFRFKPYNGSCAIVLVPTKELCVQVCSIFSQLAQFTNVKFDLIHGDSNHKDEEALLAKGCTVLFATPNSLFHHMKASLEMKKSENVDYFRYHNVKFLVLDEADRFLEDTYMITISKILECLPSERQTMILSATLNLNNSSIEKIKSFAKKWLSPHCFSYNISLLPGTKKQKKNATVDNLTEGYVVLPTKKRILFLYSLIRKIRDKKVMIFFSSSEQVEFFYSFFSLLNLNQEHLLMLHSNLTNDMRTSTLLKFNNMQSGFLLCTDVISRGIDIPDVSLVIQYDIPAESTAYIHRVGRTARAGLDGSAILLLRPNESKEVLNYLSSFSMNLIEFDTPHLDDITDFFQQIPKNSPLFKLAERAFVCQLESYKNSKLINSIKHLKLEDEIINFCLQEIPSLPKLIKSVFK